MVGPALYEHAEPDANPIGLLGSEADGGFGQYVAVAAERGHDMSGSLLSDGQLACVPISHDTAMGMLERGRISAGEAVLVTGASGGAGMALVQLAAVRGSRVVALTTRAKTDLVTRAHTVLHRDEDDLPAALARAAPQGLDAVADSVTGDAVAALLPAVHDGGRVIADALGGAVISLDLRRLYLHNISLIGSSVHTPSPFGRLAAAARAGSVRPRVAARYALTDMHTAQRKFDRSVHTGKIVIRP